MKIAYYCPPYWGDGGPATHGQGIVKGLRRLGHEVLVLPPDASGSVPLGYRPPVRLIPQSASSVVRHFRGWRRARAGGLARRCVQALQGFEPDCLIVRRPPYDLVADAVLRASRCQVVGEINAVPFLEAQNYFGRRYDWIERRREVAFYSRCDRLACVTEEVKQQLVGLGLPTDRIVVAPNGVDTELFSPSVLRKSGVFAQPPALVIGYCASLTPLHDLPVAVEAMQGVRFELGDQVSFLFLGPSREDLVAAGADERFLTSCVAMGRVPHRDVPAFMAWMDIGCVALKGVHGSPLKVMEFMAMGIPVAAAANGSGMAPLLAAGAGLVTPAGEREALKMSLLILAHDPMKRTEMGRAGRAWVTSHGTWEVSAARMIGAG